MTRDEKIDRIVEIHKSFSSKISFYANLAFDFKSKHSKIHLGKYNMYNDLAKRSYVLGMKLLKTTRA